MACEMLLLVPLLTIRLLFDVIPMTVVKDKASTDLKGLTPSGILRRN